MNTPRSKTSEFKISDLLHALINASDHAAAVAATFQRPLTGTPATRVKISNECDQAIALVRNVASALKLSSGYGRHSSFDRSVDAALIIRSICRRGHKGYEITFNGVESVIGQISAAINSAHLCTDFIDTGNFLIALDQPENSVVSSSAGRLATIATRLLPLSDRVRYTEEFRSELWDLAETRAGQWQQMMHAARLVIHAVHLRLELKSPHRSKARP